MIGSDEGLLGRLEQALATERAAWPWGNSGGDHLTHRAAQRDVFEILREVGDQGEIATIIAGELAVLANELDHYADSPTRKRYVESALQNLLVVREHWADVLVPERYAIVNGAFQLKASRLGAVPNDQIRQALRSHSAKLTEDAINGFDHRWSAFHNQRHKNIDQAERLYAARQHEALSVEPVDTMLPGCMMKIHVAHPDTGEPWQVIEWGGKRIEISADLKDVVLMWLNEWNLWASRVAFDRFDNAGVNADEAEELVAMVECAGFKVRPEILVAEESFA